jgi:hypothetical protein
MSFVTITLIIISTVLAVVCAFLCERLYQAYKEELANEAVSTVPTVVAPKKLAIEDKADKEVLADLLIQAKAEIALFAAETDGSVLSEVAEMLKSFKGSLIYTVGVLEHRLVELRKPIEIDED